MSLEECEQKCIDMSDCNAVEYWAGNSICFKCNDPSKHHSYEDKTDKGFPSSVFKQGILCFRLIIFTY